MQKSETDSNFLNLNPLMMTEFKRASKILEKAIIENKYPLHMQNIDLIGQFDQNKLCKRHRGLCLN
jgi:hypothetical protein